MADLSETVNIKVTGAEALARAGGEAEAAAEGVKELRDAAADLGGAAAGAEALATAEGHVRDNALEAAAAMKAAKDSSGGKLAAGGAVRDLLAAGEAVRVLDKSLGGESGGGGAGSSMRGFRRDTGEVVRTLRDLEGGAGDAEDALGGGEGIAGGLAGAAGFVGDAFGKVKGLAMPAMMLGIAATASTAGPALLAAGAGFGAWGALAAPALAKVKTGLSDVTWAQKQYQQAVQVQKLDPTTANAKATKSALDQLNATYAGMPANVRKSVGAVQSLEHAFSKAGKPFQAQALKDIPLVAKDLKGMIPDLAGLASAASPLISGDLASFGKWTKSKGFKQFVSNLEAEAPGANKAVKNVAGATGGIVSGLSSKKNVGIGEGLLNSIAGVEKSSGPGVTHLLGQYAKFLTGVGHTITNWQKPGHPLNVAGGVFDEGVHAGGHALSLGRTGAKAVTDWLKWGVGSGVMSGHMLPSEPWDKAFSNMQKPPAAPNFGASLRGDAAGLLGGKGARGGETVKVKFAADGAGQVQSELQKIKAAGKQNEQVRVKITSEGAAKTEGDFKAVTAAAKTAGTQAGAAIGTGISAGSGKAAAAATAVAGGVKAGVAPLPGALHATGANAGASMAAGISGETGAVSAAAAGLAAAAESAAKVHLQISSPSKKFKKIGQQTVEGWIEGLLGGKAEIDAAIKALTGTAPFRDAGITNTVKALRKEIGTAFTDKKITGSQKLAFTQLLDDDNAKLMNLAKKRASIEKQIAAAEALAKSVQSAALQTGDLGAIAGTTSAGQAAAAAASQTGLMGTDDGSGGPATMQAGLQAKLSAIQKFSKQIKTLKKDGLDKEGIRDLLNDGVDAGGQAASQILAGGKKGVEAIAKLDNSIGLASKKLGVTGGNAAYEGASQIGGQLAAGLKDSLKAVDKQMEGLEKSLITTLMLAMGKTPKQIAAAEAKLAKELGLADGSSGGSSSGGKVTAPHKIWHPKPVREHGPVRGEPIRYHPPIVTAPHVIQPAAMSGGGGALTLTATIPVTVTVAGRKVAKATQKYTLVRASSNTGSGLTLPGKTT